jgi:membrane protein YqaA with SNARE-associated domain
MTLGLFTLFLSGLLAATLLPFGSEPVFVAYLLQQPPEGYTRLAALAVLAAGLGNTMGGVLTYAMGRGARYAWLKYKRPTSNHSQQTRAQRWLQRFGPWTLIMAWLPVIGDPLCLAAGAMRLEIWRCTLAMAIGKFARYAVIAVGLAQL